MAWYFLLLSQTPQNKGGMEDWGGRFFLMRGNRRLVVDDGSFDLDLRVPPHSGLSSFSPPSYAARRGYKRRQIFSFFRY